MSMGDVADRAEVSKALVHYHFRDKDSLLLAVVEEAGRELLERERETMGADVGGHALDSYWQWFDEEIRRGDVQTLLALGQCDSDRVRAAARRIARERRRLAAEHVSLVFSRLALAPRVPAALLAETVVAFVDGASAAAALEPGRDTRPAFDVLWLALLTLAD